MSKSIVSQLRDAWQRSELSLEELAARSGLGLDFTTLSRKLAGKVRLSTEEAQTLANTLGIRIVWAPGVKAS